MTDDGPRLEAAAALRALNHAFVEHEADAELLGRIATSAREAVAELRSAVRRDMSSALAPHVARMFRTEDDDEPPLGMVNPMSDRAVGGLTNPTSADFDIQYGEEEVAVRTVLGAAFEGAPGRAHGGMVAALFDDITGFLLPMAGTPAYTGRLTVHYHRPVPIGAELEFRTRIDGRQGRKLHISAECRAGGELVASAQALFITVEARHFGTSPGPTGPDGERAAPASDGG